MRTARGDVDEDFSDSEYQARILPHVSRTFALTIPQLPPSIRTATTSAYLLCRIADTIEDEPAFAPHETERFLRRLNDVVANRADSAELATELASRLSEYSTPHERDLVRHLGNVIAATRRLDPGQQAAIRRCLRVMSSGMHEFQCTASLRGLACLEDLDRYCYHVAGVVGEMLTELFCASSPQIARHAAELPKLARSFGQGLQMTNILKDMWEDRNRGVCWLPRDVFLRHGVDLTDFENERCSPGFVAGLRELVGIAHAHLRSALAFTALIPAVETGIRRFCLWAIGLAVLTLQAIHRNPFFTAGEHVKVSRSQVMTIISVVNLSLHDDRLLQRLFERAARGLPLAQGHVAPHMPRLGALPDDFSSSHGIRWGEHA